MIIDLISILLYASIAFAMTIAVGMTGRKIGPPIVMSLLIGLTLSIVSGALQESGDILKSELANLSNDSRACLGGGECIDTQSAQSSYDFLKQKNDICSKEMQIRSVDKIYSNKTVAQVKKDALVNEQMKLIAEYNWNALHENYTWHVVTQPFSGCD